MEFLTYCVVHTRTAHQRQCTETVHPPSKKDGTVDTRWELDEDIVDILPKLYSRLLPPIRIESFPLQINIQIHVPYSDSGLHNARVTRKL